MAVTVNRIFTFYVAHERVFRSVHSGFRRLDLLHAAHQSTSASGSNCKTSQFISGTLVASVSASVIGASKGIGRHSNRRLEEKKTP
jgi:hypothetical protein